MSSTAWPGLRGRVAAGEPLRVIWLALGSVALAEIAAVARPDAIVLDLQHGLWDRLSMEAAVGIARATCPVMVRVEENNAAVIGRALDAGADGVIVPLVETAMAAAAAVAAVRFPPVGIRSGGGVRPLTHGFGDYLGRADGIVAAVMIETAAGVEAAEAIMATPGLDLVLIGTGDLLLSHGGSPDPAARREEGCRRVREAALAAGVAPGIFTLDPAAARTRIAEGYRMVVAGNDIDVVRTGFEDAVRASSGTDPA